jgi:2-polyprenyl-3-methyl-5-hydroxy-6-metoxy-1,4-benzoquinol methylase
LLTREHIPEKMDDPALGDVEHLHARTGLARLNAFSGAANILWRPIAELARRHSLKSVRVLDVATGSADVPFRLWRIGRANGLDLQIDGCDVSETALMAARDAARAQNINANFFVCDAFVEELPRDYDVVITSLFTHHLTDAQAVKLLKAMKKAARHMVLVSDLERSKLNLSMVWLATRLVTRSPVVHYDGPASVKNSYTREELAAIAEQAELDGVSVVEKFPCRMLLTWTKKNE